MKYFKYIFLILVAGAFTSCEDYFGEDANADPDNPINVSPAVILPQVQLRLTYMYGGDMTRYIGIYTRHVDGISRQFAVIGQYGIIGSDVDQAWANVYTGTLGSNRLLLNDSREAGNHHYAALALTLESYTMMMATDVWGDLAYSDAFKFNENGGVYQPTFDTQAEIYTTIFANLQEARTLLAGDPGGNTPGSDDVMYGGDAGQWTKFINLLEARAHLHMSERDDNAYNKVLAALDRGVFASSADDAQVMFGTGSTENAPWYQYIQQRDDCETGTFYVGMLTDLNDPRIATYGAPHDLSHPIWTADQTVQLLTYTEQEFIRAEAELMSGNNMEAYTAYLNGIKSSFKEALSPLAGVNQDSINVLYDEYVEQSHVGVGASSLTLENIITQKYLALYTNPEVFSDWRRTGLPNIPPVTGSQIPRRLPYAQTEIFSNPGNVPSPSEVNLFANVWWDL